MHTSNIADKLNNSNERKENIWKAEDIEECSLIIYIESLALPRLRPYVIEFTDAGPGVACNNYEVKFRELEIARLHKSALRYRVHLASDDQGQNEAERTNAYIGKVI